jgi:hypothetical protein
MTFLKGEKVLVHINDEHIPGIIVYSRMAAPQYSVPEVYSVRLETRINDVSYTGTIVRANQVSKIPGMSYAWDE